MRQLDKNGKPHGSRIVGERELVSHVEDGWEIMKELRNGRFQIKKSNHNV